MIYNQHRTEHSANSLNFNQAANTVLHTFFFPRKVTLRRDGVVSEASEGLLSVGVLNLASVIAGGATATEISDSLLAHGVRVRGVGVYKELDAARVTLTAGMLLQVRVDVNSDATSTGRVWIEVEDEPFNGANIPTTYIEAS